MKQVILLSCGVQVASSKTNLRRAHKLPSTISGCDKGGLIIALSLYLLYLATVCGSSLAVFAILQTVAMAVYGSK